MSNQGGKTQVVYQSDTTNGEFPNGWHAENFRLDLEGVPLETDGAALPRRHRLPPSPSRSLGGYLDYAGWPDRERFMELDSVLRCRSQGRGDSDDHADSDEGDLRQYGMGRNSGSAHPLLGLSEDSKTCLSEDCEPLKTGLTGFTLKDALLKRRRLMLIRLFQQATSCSG
jgi:hypothetical protein